MILIYGLLRSVDSVRYLMKMLHTNHRANTNKICIMKLTHTIRDIRLFLIDRIINLPKKEKKILIRAHIKDVTQEIKQTAADITGYYGIHYDSS